MQKIFFTRNGSKAFVFVLLKIDIIICVSNIIGWTWMELYFLFKLKRNNEKNYAVFIICMTVYLCSVITEPTQRYKWHELVEAIVSYISWWAKTAALQGIDFFGSKDFIPLLIRPIWYKLLSYTTARNKLLLDSLNNEMWILGAI